MAYNEKTILEETLECNQQIILSCVEQKLIDIAVRSDLYDKKKIKEIYDVECKDAKQNQQYTLLSILSKNYANLSIEITKIYGYLTEYIDICSCNNYCPIDYSVARLTEELGDEQLALDKITKIIRNFDIDIENIKLEHKKGPIEDLLGKRQKNIRTRDLTSNIVDYTDIYSYHRNMNNELVQFEIYEESDGTQTLMSILGLVLTTLEKGGTLLVDELDKSMHPLLLIQLTRLFKDKRYNKKNAQLIFTLHDTDLLEDEHIRKSEIAIVSKTKKNGTLINKISNYEGLRNVTDFRKRYLQGEFSGIPQAHI